MSRYRAKQINYVTSQLLTFSLLLCCDKLSKSCPRHVTAHSGLLCSVLMSHREQQGCFLGNEIFVFGGQEQIPFKLCSAQLQLRWYGLFSISTSWIDKLTSITHWSIIAAIPRIILPTSPLLSFSGNPSVSMYVPIKFFEKVCFLFLHMCVFEVLLLHVYIERGGVFLHGSVGVTKSRSFVSFVTPLNSRET